jgi:DNA-directed RNA polymerase subunit beta'
MWRRNNPKSSASRKNGAYRACAAPVVHVWFMKSIPSRISMILDRGIKELEKILYFEKYVVLEPGFSHFQKNICGTDLY